MPLYYLSIVFCTDMLDCGISELEPFREQLPLFITKLYTIMQLPQYNQYIGWHNGHVAIKHSRNLVHDRVLKHFFKLKNFASFIRQLNIYGFRKVPSMVQRKHLMLFQHPHFKPNQPEQLLLIKRQPSRTREKLSTASITIEHEENPSIEHKIPQPTKSGSFITKVEQTAAELIRSLKELQRRHPGLSEEIGDVIGKCQGLESGPKRETSWGDWEVQVSNISLCCSSRAIPSEPQPFFPSIQQL